MKLENPWKCDECGALKQPSNGWYVGLDNYEVCFFTPAEELNGLVIIPWNSAIAELTVARHLCGVECVGRFVAKSLVKERVA